MELTHIGVRQFAGNVQSQSRTLFFSGVERLKEMVADFGRNAFAVIGNDVECASCRWGGSGR